MTPVENPECPKCDCANSVERIGEQWVCSGCDHAWLVGSKRPESKIDTQGTAMDDDG